MKETGTETSALLNHALRLTKRIEIILSIVAQWRLKFYQKEFEIDAEELMEVEAELKKTKMRQVIRMRMLKKRARSGKETKAAARSKSAKDPKELKEPKDPKKQKVQKERKEPKSPKRNQQQWKQSCWFD